MSGQGGSGPGPVGSWVPAFEGQRPPFRPGHELSKRHGAYAGSTVLAKAPRVVELAAEARAAAPWLTAADEPALRLYALSVARLELASQVLLDPIGENAGAVEEWRKKVELSPTLSRDSRGWANTAVRLAAELGLTPAGRAAIEDRLASVVALEDVQRLLAIFVATVVELGALAARVDAATVEQHMVELDDALSEIEGVEMPRSGEEAPVDAEFEPIADVGDGGETAR